jgi:hypothetical protein
MKEVASIEVYEGDGNFGHPELALRIFWRLGYTHWRLARAYLLRAAAIIEEVTPAAEKWVVCPCEICVWGKGIDVGLVTLELAVADEAEIGRARTLLEAVVAKLRKERK